MKHKQKNKQKHEGNSEKNLLIYSLYIALASVSFFISINLAYIAFLGYIWSYTTTYVVNTAATAVILFIASALLFISCIHIIKDKKHPYTFGVIGCFFYIPYPVYVLFIDSYALSLTYHTIFLVIPALIGIFLVAFNKKIKLQYPFFNNKKNNDNK